MRIIVCTRKDLKGNIALNHLLSGRLVASHQVTVILSDLVSSAEKTIKELIYYEFLEHDLPAVYFNALESFSKTGRATQKYYTFHQLAQRYGIPITLMGNVNTGETTEYIRSFQPDVILSCRYDYIFKTEVIRIPRIGILNIHPGALPAYRGVLAPFYALMNDEHRLGVTIHWIDEGIDTGNILKIEYIERDAQKSVFDYYLALYILGIHHVLELLPILEQGQRLPGVIQKEGTYYHYPASEQFVEFEKKGFTLVNLNSYLEYLSLYY